MVRDLRRLLVERPRLEGIGDGIALGPSRGCGQSGQNL